MTHLGEVTANIDRFRAANTSVLAVSQATPTVLAKFLQHSPQPFPVVCDPDRIAYRAFDLERTSWLSFFHPVTVWEYLSLIVRGGKVRVPYRGEDVLQLGGDFVLDRTGNVVFEYRSRTATDRPSIAALLAATAATGYR